MEYLMIVAACAAVVGYLILRHRNPAAPQDTYVCDVCGEKECICHKVEKE